MSVDFIIYIHGPRVKAFVVNASLGGFVCAGRGADLQVRCEAKDRHKKTGPEGALFLLTSAMFFTASVWHLWRGTATTLRPA